MMKLVSAIVMTMIFAQAAAFMPHLRHYGTRLPFKRGVSTLNEK